MSRRCRLCPLGGSCPPDPHPAAPLGSCRSQGGFLCPCIESSCKGRTRAGRRCSSTSAALHLGSPSRCNLQMKELGLSLRPGREQRGLGWPETVQRGRRASRQGQACLRVPLPRLECLLGAGRGWGGQGSRRHSFLLFAFLLGQMAV